MNREIPWEHGTVERWVYGCSCVPCHSAVQARRKASRVSRGLPDGDERHGTRNGYNNYGCHCGPCTEANRVYYRKYRENRREASNA